MAKSSRWWLRLTVSKINSVANIYFNIFSEPANVEPVASTQKSIVTTNKHMSIISSPALSQISRDGLAFTPGFQASKKKTSTPFAEKLKAFQSQDAPMSALSEIQNIGVKRKRQRLEDLFGDIYDIEEEDVFKRPKTDEERDFDTIQRIIDARKDVQTQINPLKKTNFDQLEALHKFKRENLSRSIPKWVSYNNSKCSAMTHGW